jgi:hypothetical protein
MTTKHGMRAFLVFAAAILGLSACRLFNTPPSVQINEGDQTVENGVPAVFTATVTDPNRRAPTLQWYLNDLEQVGQTTDTFQVTLSPTDLTNYAVRVVADDGYATAEDAATLIVKKPYLAVEIVEGDFSVANGQAAIFTTRVTNPSPTTVSYRWLLDGRPLPDSISSSLSLTLAPNQPQVYEVMVEARTSMVTATASATLTVGGPASFQVRHEDLVGDFTYTLNFDSPPARDVYFVFTNTARTMAPAQVTVAPQFGVQAPRFAAPRLTSVTWQDARAPRGILRDRPEATAFNRTPRVSAGVTPASRRSVVVPAPRRDVVGGTTSFLDKNDLQQTISIPATCRQTVSGVTVPTGGTRTLNVWVANDCWTVGGSKANLVTQQMVDAIAEKFLSSSPGLDNDIYDWVTGVYGPEWGSHSRPAELIPSNNEVTVLLYDISNDNSTTGGIVGYFWAKDNFLNAPPSFDYSNERVMFYLDAVMLATGDGAWGIGDFWPQEMISTLAHEFQHMIHFYQKAVLRSGGAGSETWIEEMLSQATEDLVAKKMQVDGPRGVAYGDGTAGSSGNARGRLPLYNYWNDTPLTTWLTTYPEVLRSYSAAYAFGAYLMRDFGGAELLRRIVQNSQTTEAAVEQALGELGYQKTFEELLAMWGAAGLLSDQVPGPNVYVYNTGTYFSSVLDPITYQYGSINLYNYTEQNYAGPYVYTTSPIGTANQAPTCNAVYHAGSGLTGLVSWAISLPAGVRLTVVQK